MLLPWEGYPVFHFVPERDLDAKAGLIVRGERYDLSKACIQDTFFITLGQGGSALLCIALHKHLQ